MKPTVMMPAGKYVICDLCYVMHDVWDECCKLFFAGRDDHGCNEGKFELKDGRKFANFNTFYGDGQYSSTITNKFCVDSGSIGCIKVEDIRDETYRKEMLEDLGAIVTFDEDFLVSSKDGTLSFGKVDIYTNDDHFESESEEYDDCYDEDED